MTYSQKTTARMAKNQKEKESVILKLSILFKSNRGILVSCVNLIDRAV